MKRPSRSPENVVQAPFSYCFRLIVPADLQRFVGRREICSCGRKVVQRKIQRLRWHSRKRWREEKLPLIYCRCHPERPITEWSFLDVVTNLCPEQGLGGIAAHYFGLAHEIKLFRFGIFSIVIRSGTADCRLEGNRWGALAKASFIRFGQSCGSGTLSIYGLGDGFSLI
jgi:hypothetical protein